MFLISTTCCQSALDIRDLQCLKLDRNHTETDKDKFSLSKIFKNTHFFAHMHLKFTLSKVTNSVAYPGCLSPITDPDYLPSSNKNKKSGSTI
jgi:hypothetical protein